MPGLWIKFMIIALPGSGLFFKQFRAVRVLTIASQYDNKRSKIGKTRRDRRKTFISIFLLPLFRIFMRLRERRF